VPITAGAQLVLNAGDTMQAIVDGVPCVSNIIAEIPVAAGEQSTGIGQVTQAVAHLDEVTQQNAALVEESSAAGDFLKEQSCTLEEVVRRFHLTEVTPMY
jgi:methyl-accepting chemotaxis protein